MSEAATIHYCVTFERNDGGPNETATFFSASDEKAWDEAQSIAGDGRSILTLGRVVKRESVRKKKLTRDEVETQNVQYLLERRAALVEFLKGCRRDMHEPDEQGVTAVVVGEHLDNAFGDSGEGNELVVEIVKDDNSSPQAPPSILKINLATLIAIARLPATGGSSLQVAAERVISHTRTWSSYTAQVPIDAWKALRDAVVAEVTNPPAVEKYRDTINDLVCQFATIEATVAVLVRKVDEARALVDGDAR